MSLRLEDAAVALAVRPLLWRVLPVGQQRVLRMRIDGQAYTAIAETSPQGYVTTDYIKRVEVNAIAKVLECQTAAVFLDRIGHGGRYLNSRWAKEEHGRQD